MKKLPFSLLGLGFLSLSVGCATRALAREIPAGFPESSAQPLQPATAEDPAEQASDRHAGHEHQDYSHATHRPDSGQKAPETDVYTCPMHPEVVSHEPGQCPQCGMHLEKKK